MKAPRNMNPTGTRIRTVSSGISSQGNSARRTGRAWSARTPALVVDDLIQLGDDRMLRIGEGCVLQVGGVELRRFAEPILLVPVRLGGAPRIRHIGPRGTGDGVSQPF